MPKEKIEITVTPKHNGTLLSTIYKGQYYNKLYMGYTKREAFALFREYVREEVAKIIVEKQE